MNFKEELQKIIKNLEGKPSILLHSCCAPCSSHVLEYLRNYFNITVLYYNPNIEPKDEYLKRKEEQKRLINEVYSDVSFLDCDYDNDVYEKMVKGLESEDVVSYTIKCLENNKLVIIPGLIMKISAFLNRLVPKKIILKVVYKIQRKKLYIKSKS